MVVYGDTGQSHYSAERCDYFIAEGQIARSSREDATPPAPDAEPIILRSIPVTVCRTHRTELSRLLGRRRVGSHGDAASERVVVHVVAGYQVVVIVSGLDP